MTAAHDQKTTHSYTLHFPEHGPRPSDPHYVDFEAYKKLHKDDAQCYVGLRKGFQDCSLDKPLELHHAHLEFALTNGVDWQALEKDYPGISDASKVGAWVESDQNFRFLCVVHHRSTEAGAHSIDHSDWEANQYVKGFTAKG